MHIPKTGGRTMINLAYHISGRPFCKFAPLRSGIIESESLTLSRHGVDYGNKNSFLKLLKSKQGQIELANASCFSTYEGGWDLLGGFGATSPLIVTMLRHPTSWAISAINHEKVGRMGHPPQGEGIDGEYR